MAGCMLFVFAALGEFVVVKVLDVQYQYQINRVPKVLPMVSVLCTSVERTWAFCLYVVKVYAYNLFDIFGLQKISSPSEKSLKKVFSFSIGNS